MGNNKTCHYQIWQTIKKRRLKFFKTCLYVNIKVIHIRLNYDIVTKWCIIRRIFTIAFIFPLKTTIAVVLAPEVQNLLLFFLRKSFISSRPEAFLRKGVLKIYSKFTGEHPWRNAISMKLLCNFTQIALRYGSFPVNLLHIFRPPFLKNTSGWLLLKFVSLKLFLLMTLPRKCWYSETPWSGFFHIRTEYGDLLCKPSVFNPNAGEHRHFSRSQNFGANLTKMEV